MRIVISGTYGTGKSTLSRLVAEESGLPLVAARGMRAFLKEHFGGRPLDECDYLDLLELGVRRFEERVATEAAHPHGFVSDGSPLNEWAYGLGRVKFGLSLGAHPERHMGQQPTFNSVIQRLGRVFHDHARHAYDLVIHLPIEFPIDSDGHRPKLEAYRSYTDTLLREAAEALDAPTIENRGDVGMRAATVAAAISKSAPRSGLS